MTALHERIKPLGWLRNPIRAALFSFFKKASETDDGKAIAAAALKGLLASQPDVLDGTAAFATTPYPELGQPQWMSRSLREDVIFITGRFRSGSTLLWNLFRHLDGYTAYYEPLNERRWFDPRARGDRVDRTHTHVTEYWKEYEGLDELGRYYHESWTSQNLLMDSTFWDPALQRYVEILIERAPARPALQFNRIDFRLPWFRRRFPRARIIHLYRHPRDQWCSSLLDLNCFPRDAAPADFARHDKFYLLSWARDLRYHFPFLDPQAVSHPYQLFYYIWKLSYLFGRKYADYSLAFEELVNDPAGQLGQLFGALDIDSGYTARCQQLIVKQPLGKWKAYAPDDWFREHEATCETVLAEFLGHVPERALKNGMTAAST